MPAEHRFQPVTCEMNVVFIPGCTDMIDTVSFACPLKPTIGSVKSFPPEYTAELFAQIVRPADTHLP